MMECRSQYLRRLPARRPPADPLSDDRDLLLRSAWDDAAFTALFQRHRTELQGFLYRRLRSLDEAEDAVAITFAKAWRARTTFRGSAPGKSWLYQIATRVALDLLRRRKRRVPELELDGECPDLPEWGLADAALDPAGIHLEEVRRAGTQQAVGGALERLTPEEQRLLTLFYFQGYDYAQIGSLLGVTRSQVRGRLHRIRGRLRQDLVNRQRWSPV